MIELRDIHKSYMLGSVPLEVLRGITLRVEKGELLSVVGASGCGKSTLMNILGFLDTPSSGQYFFEERESSNLDDGALSRIRNQRIGFCFQQFNLLPRLSARDNVCLPLLYRGVGKSMRIEKASEMLDRVGMADRMNHRPSELSGGQQQRVAIARALVGEPALILADEPTGALDSTTSDAIMSLFSELNREKHITTIIITHDPDLARQCARIVHMSDGALVEEES
ncbi:ABC transporter ATP-binding protein [Pseudodesulfovibrio senegalensis]|uniref:ABC transporter ATP-binding protein n=1 Tax=Pseudodesulfovibrio senegalensis TaxID=1721087 RepID=A0A6N6N2B5_9BACT|nr:ABC transporter ATP-binding protein [Pseudodesulfovibrio senegalensis]KAB1441528.1 ABC transporter ATP-binding protein [Pseudodesulfovibrio senegalensis]